MGCGCSGGAAAAMKTVQQYEIQGDPENKTYITEREAITAKNVRQLPGTVVPVQ